MISAKIIADSICYPTGARITTFEVSFPRWILAELNTHRVFGRNSASSRAIPLKSNINNILNNTAIPVYWGKSKQGMVADEEISGENKIKAEEIWLKARDSAIDYALQLEGLGIHKQISNRLIENFSYQKVIITATEWTNFFNQRAHKDAQPEFRELAYRMLDLYNSADNIEVLYEGEWHTPYVNHTRINSDLYYISNDGNFLNLESALKISSSSCAQVSYRKNDDSLDKALDIFSKLNLFDENSPKHLSPLDHQASPITNNTKIGITHADINNEYNKWSGNLRGWVQYRHCYDKLNFSV